MIYNTLVISAVQQGDSVIHINIFFSTFFWILALGGKEFSCQCRRHKWYRFSPWVGKIPWRREWEPTPVSLPGEIHGQRSLAGYSPWCCKELNTTEWLPFSLSFIFIPWHQGITCHLHPLNQHSINSNRALTASLSTHLTLSKPYMNASTHTEWNDYSGKLNLQIKWAITLGRNIIMGLVLEQLVTFFQMIR